MTTRGCLAFACAPAPVEVRNVNLPWLHAWFRIFRIDYFERISPKAAVAIERAQVCAAAAPHLQAVGGVDREAGVRVHAAGEKEARASRKQR